MPCLDRFRPEKCAKIISIDRRVSLQKPPTSAKNRKAHIRWCREWHDWTAKDWKKVMWSDESCCTLLYMDICFQQPLKPCFGGLSSRWLSSVILPELSHHGDWILKLC
ncbi:hypothetical protein AVEN_269587-1 [Araneus ventricosus]|uniref:Transposase Tc1-like domain-containing protein n=1 Tax=Araneus ventricosus TaxID=182803 RepID=A0A4Y2CDE0_ARAVE|nr:hypothetical protein AVEN_269587-1 [Araneus ventricosus]